ncbi:MAG: hypothetical protein HWN81_00300 [Candidatus Lokiarchaeota archaeon]|nr:hypothetical protein [Candidatus Lokiarchaeota archaeon]
MSQSAKQKVHKVTIRNKVPGTISTGANTEVLLDGKVLKAVNFAKIEIKASKAAKLTLEMFVDADEVEIDTPIKCTSYRPLKRIVNWVIGKYESYITT